jgi:anti-sigma factor RsiW
MLGRHPESELIADLRGELSPPAHDRLARHLQGCARCRASAAAYARLLGELGRELERTPTPDWQIYRAQVMQKVAHVAPLVPPRRWRPALAWSSLGAAALATAALLLTINLRPPAPPSMDQLTLQEAMADTDLDMLRAYPVLQHLDLIENYDVISRLDELSPAPTSANPNRS